MKSYLTLSDAIEKVVNWLNSIQDENNPLQIIPEETIERFYGWFFFYDSKQFIDTGNYDFMIAGNAPILVDKLGALHLTGTAHSVEYYIAEYDKIFSSRDDFLKR